MKIKVESPIIESNRVQQLRGMFDLPSERTSKIEWNVQMPLDEKPWHLGLIVGPSGSGKSTIAKQLFAEAFQRQETLEDWPSDQCILDAFPQNLSIKTIVELLCSVGFASPPAWLRPFHVLSTGQQFRVELARLLTMDGLTVMDEFTSTVDRTVAQIGSAALGRTVRRRKQQFVAITCHEDVEAWLRPDWVYRPAEQSFQWRCLWPRPSITLEIVRCQASAWSLFAPHHYLSHQLLSNAVCFLANWQNRPVAFSAWIPFVGRGPKTKREHRTVTLPDYQGVGIGNALSDFVASLWQGLGYRAISTTTHPAMIRSRCRSANWKCHRSPSLASSRRDVMQHATTRLTAGFKYIGPALSRTLAQTLLNV